MKNLLLSAISILVLWSCSSPNQEKSKGSEEQPDPSITVPGGFIAQVVADSLGRGRHITVRDNGDIYVRLRNIENGGGIAALRDNDGDGRSDEVAYFDDFGGTGVDINNGYLYFASDSVIYRQALDNNLVPQTERETIVADLPNQRNHAAKPITFDGQGNLYVNVGAPSNACQEKDREKGSPGQDPCPYLERQGSIWRFSDSKLNQKQMEDGYRYSTGIRNVVALEWNKGAGSLYGVQHGRDMLDILFPDLYDSADNAELPAEEFYKFVDGGDFGWPFCYYDGLSNTKLQMPEYGGDGQAVGRCADVEQPILAFPGHIAPNDLLFYSGDQFPEKYRNGAFVAFHGSWNRAPLPQKGYFIAFVPFKNGNPSGDWEIFADDFGGDPGEIIVSPRDAEFRPTGLAQGPNGNLFIVDSVKGRVWSVSYTKSA